MSSGVTGSSLLSSRSNMEEESPSKRDASRDIVERRFWASKLAGPDPSWYLRCLNIDTKCDYLVDEMIDDQTSSH